MSKPLKRPYIIPFFIPFQGCPFHCIYCDQESITNNQSQLPNAEDIKNKISLYLKSKKPHRYSHTEVAFYGGTFTGLPYHEIIKLLEPTLSFQREGLINSIRFSTKPDLIDGELLKELKALGLGTVELGVQSMSDFVLKKSARGYQSQDVVLASEVIKKLALQLVHQLMPGLPGAGQDEAMSSLKKSLACKPDALRIYPTVVIKGTALERLFMSDQYQPLKLHEALAICREMRALCEIEQVPIIKMGLEFSSDDEKNIVAGPYHPSFRSLLQ